MIAHARHETWRGSLPSPQPPESDLLTTLLEPCRFRSVIHGPRRVVAPWGFEVAKSPPGFYLVLEGGFTFEVPDLHNRWSLAAHDLVILTRRSTHTLCDRSGSRLVTVQNHLQPADLQVRDVPHYAGDGPPTRLMWGSFAGEDDYTRQTFALLPPVVVLRGNSPAASDWFRPLLAVILSEAETARPGGALVLNRLLQALLVQSLRESSVSLPESGGGLLAAMRVPGLGSTIAAMHARPEYDWSVHELADMTGLSRAAFAVRFLETIGVPPFEYLRDLRMRVACRLLRETEKGLKDIASRVGYSTEASFSKAFSRWCGRAPGEYRRQSRAGS